MRSAVRSPIQLAVSLGLISVPVVTSIMSAQETLKIATDDPSFHKSQPDPEAKSYILCVQS